MKSNFVFFVLFFVFFVSFGQKMPLLHRMFLQLPQSAVLWSVEDDAPLMLQCYIDKNIDAQIEKRCYSIIDTIDLLNGYMRVSIISGFWEMCFWSLEDKTKRLVSVTHGSCGPMCGSDELLFYIYENEEFAQLNTEDIIPDVWQFLVIKHPQEEDEDLIQQAAFSPLIYSLPQQGKNIVVYFEIWEGEEIVKEFFFGNAVELKWDNGVFKKGRVFWDNQNIGPQWE
jgi:hypothetical protein